MPLLTQDPGNLQQRYDAAIQSKPQLRIRDHAKNLGVGEAALVALDCKKGGTIRLKPDFHDLLIDLGNLGEVMALTRNDHAVHEKTGKYENISVHHSQGLVLGDEIDLRLFLNMWAHAFFVREDTKMGVRNSLQIFNKAGAAVHKIYMKPESSQEGWRILKEKYMDTDQSQEQPLEEMQMQDAATSENAHIDRDAFRSAWADMKDTHEFFGLLKKFNLARIPALRLAGKDFARQTPLTAVTTVFEMAVDQALPIMVFVGNSGAIQIHTGEIHKLVTTGPWFNILDSRFNLHLRTDAITECWVVRKPTSDGIVTSLEFFDDRGDVVAMLFGKRKPGHPELEKWRSIIDSLEVKRAA